MQQAEQIDYCRIPIDDLDWASNQPPSVWKLFTKCWNSDRFGSRWMHLNHNLSQSSFRSARRALEKAGLFIFRKIQDYADARATAYWEVRNLKGCRVAEFWKPGFEEKSKIIKFSTKKSASNLEPIAVSVVKNDSRNEIGAENSAPISRKTSENQGFQEPSTTPQQLLNNSSEELGRSKDEKKSSLGGEDFFQEKENGNKRPLNFPATDNSSSSLSDWENFLLKFHQLGWDKSGFSLEEIANRFSEKDLPQYFPETNHGQINSEWNVDAPEARQKVEQEFQQQRSSPEYARAKLEAVGDTINQLRQKLIENCSNPIRRQFLKNKYGFSTEVSADFKSDSSEQLTNNFSTDLIEDEEDWW